MKFKEWFTNRGMCQSKMTTELMKEAFNAGRLALEKENAELTSNLKEHKRLHKVLANILKHDAENPSLCDLVSIVAAEIESIAELRAQLARCVDKLLFCREYIQQCGCTLESGKIASFVESLPKTASIDAEILRCTGVQEKAVGFEWTAKCYETDNAVRARNEVK